MRRASAGGSAPRPVPRLGGDRRPGLKGGWTPIALVALVGGLLAAGAASGADLAIRSLDVCASVPVERVAAIVGTLREAPRPEKALGQEDRACGYRTTRGETVEIRVSPASRWEILEAIQKGQARPVAGIGTRALEREAATNRFVYAVGARVMVQAAVTKGLSLDQARRLAQLTLDALR